MTDSVAVALIAGIPATIGAIVSAIGMLRSQENGRNIAAVHHEVKTTNGLTLGELADDAETRRAVDTPADDRTDAEQQHIDAVPDKRR